MNGMILYESLSHIDDAFILGSMPPPAKKTAKKPRLQALSNFVNSGIGAAVISGIVALGVLIAIVMAGRADPLTPPSPFEDTTAQNGHSAAAMEAFEAALAGDVCVIDRDQGEIKLSDCRFPGDNVRLGEWEILYKVILDMDGDGIVEYVIQSPAKEHIVLRCYQGRVYSYSFDSDHFYNLNTDGSFYWMDLVKSENRSRGLSQLVFDGSSASLKEIYRLSPPDDEEAREYYVDGKLVSSEEFANSGVIYRTNAVFTPLDISCAYPISSEMAYELAMNYWGVKNGAAEGAAGTTYVSRIVIAEKPSSDHPWYRVCWQVERYSNHVPGYYDSLPPQSVYTQRELFVDAVTGECREEIDDPLTVVKAFEAVIAGDVCVIDRDQGEIKLQDLRIPGTIYALDEIMIDGKAVLDLDGDGMEEYVICLASGDSIILRYHGGQVYSYFLEFRQFYNLKADGTFSWNDASGTEPFCYGGGKLFFDGTELNVKETYKIVGDGEPNAAYYVNGQRVTYEELLTFNGSHRPASVEFTAFGEPWKEIISLYQALNIAEKYWYDLYGIRPGDRDSETGYAYALLRKSSDHTHYCIALSLLVEGTHFSTLEIIYVDAFTGEVSESGK